MKDPKKIEAGKRLAAINCKKREAKKREEAQNGGMNQYYGIGVVIAVGVIGGLGYYIYRTKKGQVQVQGRALQAPADACTQLCSPPQQPRPQTNKFEMD